MLKSQPNERAAINESPRHKKAAPFTMRLLQSENFCFPLFLDEAQGVAGVSPVPMLIAQLDDWARIADPRQPAYLMVRSRQHGGNFEDGRRLTRANGLLKEDGNIQNKKQFVGTRTAAEKRKTPATAKFANPIWENLTLIP